ncbi:MAG: hypothetical protein IKJ19_03975 [Clostridia bacterium]|nr:hypothetical protein [Clostridia bacterium]
MKSLLISGISGQVGTYLSKFAKNYGFNLICGVDRKRFCEADCPIYTSFNEVKENVDLIIDFSSPALCSEAIDFCFKNDCKLVVGTTGLFTAQLENLKLLSQTNAVCKENNFSKSIVPFLQACNIIKSSLPEFDLSLIEEHHKRKKDAPSGTAKFLAEHLQITDVHSLRGGNVAGVHKVVFLGEGEEIEITHRAYEKGIFAKGALYCAQKLLKKEKGLFSLEQLLNEEKAE